MPRIYTRSGDSGETWAPLAGRVSKTHPCVAAVGDLDEAESFTALAEAFARQEGDEEAAKVLELVQEMLFRIGFQLWRSSFGKREAECVKREDVERVERMIDELLPEAPRLFQMHAPHPLPAAIAAARAVVRRAERSLWRCIEEAGVEPRGALAEALRLANRLSDLLYALEYSVAKRLGLLRQVAC